MTNDPLRVLQSREELYSKDATGQVIIAFMQLTLVCFLQMQHFEQVITEQTEEMSWQLCVSTREVEDLFIFPRREFWVAGISTFTLADLENSL